MEEHFDDIATETVHRHKQNDWEMNNMSDWGRTLAKPTALRHNGLKLQHLYCLPGLEVCEHCDDVVK